MEKEKNPLNNIELNKIEEKSVKQRKNKKKS